jgi:Cu(I)/Ag(I) efflux system membrane fusion protein
MNEFVTKYLNIIKPIASNTWVKTAFILILGIMLGSFLFSTGSTGISSTHEDHSDETIWTCSMHPQVKLDEPGQCPICFMDLIPLEATSSADNHGQYFLSETAVKLAKISTTAVRRGKASSQIRLSGKISYDETRVKAISAWFPGRLERLFVDYTGIQVNAGDHLFEIYSPELYSAQKELLLAHGRMSGDASSTNGSAGKSAFQAAQEKTKLLGLSDAQINAIIQRGSANSTIQINSPITGIVTHKNAVEGKYVRTGEQIYTIADLSKVWLVLDAYEKDLAWLAYGQELTFQVAGLPGHSYSAKISYIDPLVDPLTRSVTVRAVLENPQGLLKPGMLAEASISVTLSGSGHVLPPDLSGKWVCPMHPEVMKDHSGDCPICGMDLIKFSTANAVEARSPEALLIPASAVLKTGKRALVYVELESDEGSTYELREIILGPHVGDEYIIISGIEEGERVVTHGNFKIDSAMQIAGKRSMMSAAESEDKVAVSHEFQMSLESIYQEYLTLQRTLAGDDLEGSRSALNKLRTQINTMGSDGKRIPELWASIKSTLTDEIAGETGAVTMVSIRASFEHLSEFVLDVQHAFGHTNQTMLYEVYCPMAFDNKGATWLQTDKQVKNPYFGASMLSCGEVKQSYAPVRMSHE